MRSRAWSGCASTSAARRRASRSRPTGCRLYVNNFMDRTVGVYDLAPLLQGGQYSVPLLATLTAVATEKLAANVLAGKKLFYDARDPRLARAELHELRELPQRWRP